jgi:hypothetical protein
MRRKDLWLNVNFLQKPSGKQVYAANELKLSPLMGSTGRSIKYTVPRFIGRTPIFYEK